MAFNFPDSPTVGQVFQSWTWNGVAWVLTAGDYVKRAGDTMTGHLSLPTGPAAANAVRKDYVDAAVAGTVSKSYVDTQDAAINANANTKLPIAGGTITGPLTVNGELVAATNYLRFVTAGGPGYIQYNGGGNYGLGGGGNIWHTGNLNPQSALGYTPVNRAGDTMTGVLNTAMSGSIATGGPVPSIMVNGYNNDWACMSFLSNGVFGANFGMHPNGNFYMGGWSHGATWYNFWTSRDFGAPNFAPYVNNGRLAYAGDFTSNNGGIMQEPWGGTVVTGYFTQVSGSPYDVHQFRHRYMQLLTTGWFTIGYA